jgi:hypothetical protein
VCCWRLDIFRWSTVDLFGGHRQCMPISLDDACLWAIDSNSND